ncbi:MAG TPA: flagellar basal body rod protein FlgB [Stellaceae bacterium]|nr:flagellar basal body rod protein FlgB [Stellaceae bacterium]
MDIGRIPLFEALTKRMGWLSARQTVLAENVANANTPGYVAKDLKKLDFGALLGKSPAAGSGPLQLAATEPGHITSATQSDSGQIVTVPDDHSLDGNGVSLEAQMMKVSTNAADYALVTTLYKQNVGLIKIALGGAGPSG